MQVTPDLKIFTPNLELLNFILKWLSEKSDSFGIGWSLEVKSPVGITFENEPLIKRVYALGKKEMEEAGIEKVPGIPSYAIRYEYKGKEYIRWVEPDSFIILPKDTEKWGEQHKSKYPILVEVSRAYLKREGKFYQGFGVIRDIERGSIELTEQTLESFLLGKGGHLQYFWGLYSSGGEGRLTVNYNDGKEVRLELGMEGKAFARKFFSNYVGFIRYKGKDSVELTAESLRKLLQIAGNSINATDYYMLSSDFYNDPRSSKNLIIIIDKNKISLDLGNEGKKIVSEFLRIRQGKSNSSLAQSSSKNSKEAREDALLHAVHGGSVLIQPSKSQEKRIQEIIAKFDNKDSYSSAKRELIQMGEPAIPQLVQALGTSPSMWPFNPSARYYPNPIADGARDTLKSLGIVSAPYLIDATYKTDNGRLFNNAVQLLSDLDMSPQTEQEKIVYYFVTESKNYSVASAFGSKDTKDFVKLTEIGSAAVPFLLRVAQMDDIGSYSNPIAIGALGALGPAAKEALPELEKLLKAAQPWETNFFYSAISKIGGEDAFRILVNGLLNKEVDTATKTFIILYLNDVGVKAEQIINILKRMIKEDSREIRIAAYVVLSSDDFFKYPGIDQIVFGGLDDPDSLVKYNVINFLGSKGAKAAFALPKLRQIVADPKTEENYGGMDLRGAAKEAIKKIMEGASAPSGKNGNGGQFSQSRSPVTDSGQRSVVSGQQFTSDKIRNASDELGGIDMNAINLDREGGGVDIQFDPVESHPVELQELIDAGIDGFAPVIINITPLPSVLPLLGLDPANKKDPLEVSVL